MASKRYFLTTAIAYPNGPPHIGHAYEAIATDAIARFMRLDGYDVFFLTGTDEHGMKMLQTAAKEGLTARELAERNVVLFEAMVKRLNCSNDDFIRTTDERHHESSREIWRRMEKNGDVYLDKYAGWYSVRDEAFYSESETTVGEDGVRRGPTGTPVEWVEEESYFFRLSAYQDKLLDLYARVPNFVLPKERLNEVASFVRGGLQDLSISRTTFDWGIRVPGDDKHIMYVWVDALTNYITGVGFPDTDSDMFRRYWPADLHVIGKDIVRFHAVYWPAFLMSAGVEVPRRVFSHGFLFNRGEKMSKSVGNVIDPFALADAYGVDQLRYFFLREVPFGQDGNYSHEAIVARINADLANDLGNLAQRSLTMIGKAFSGALPAPGAFSANDNTILAAADAMIGKAREAMATQQLHQVLNTVWAVVADANRYFAGEAPWALAKTDPQRQGTVLYVTAEVLRQIAILTQPFMPDSAGKLLDLLAIPAAERNFAMLGGAARIVAGSTLPPPAPVFPRYVEPAPEAGNSSTHGIRTNHIPDSPKESPKSARSNPGPEKEQTQPAASATKPLSKASPQSAPLNSIPDEDRTQRVRDPVHGLIVFRKGDPLAQLAWRLINTPEFQRLRRIKQLGVSEFVYPGATHTRFAHSLGVFHTARALIKIIKRELRSAKQEFSEERAEVAVIAALLHDLGHGPFSHTFESVQQSRGVKKKHERWTAEIIRNPEGGIRPLLDAYRLDVYSVGTFTGEVAKLFEGEEDPVDIYHAVVSSSFDADRLDYLRRDKLMTGTGAGAIDFDWLMEQLRVHEVSIEAADADDEDKPMKVPTFCFDAKALPAAEQFLLARYTLHEQVYFHKTTRCVEHMLAKLLRQLADIAADPDCRRLTGLDGGHPLIRFFQPSSATLANYLSLDDVVVSGAIERMVDAEDPSIADLARRLRERRLYKTLDLRAAFGHDPGKQTMAARRIDKDFKQEIANGTVIKDEGATVSLYTEIGGDDEKTHKKLHILDPGRGPREITDVSPDFVGQLKEKKQFTRYYFERESDRNRARGRKKGDAP